MKFFLLLFLIILTININAEINIIKEEYSPKETFQAELYFPGIIDEIQIIDVKILKLNNDPTDIGIKLYKISNELYFVNYEIPNVENGIYKLVVNNIKKLENNILKKENYEKEFKITNNTNTLSLNPAFIVFNDNNVFKINLKNNENIQNISIYDFKNLTNINPSNLILNKNSENSFYITILNKTEPKIDIFISYSNKNYTLPIYNLNNIKEPKLQTIKFFTIKENGKIYLQKYIIEIPSRTYSTASFFIESNNNLTDLELNLDSQLKEITKLGFDKIEFLNSNEIKEISLFLTKPLEKNTYSGNLIIKNNYTEAKFPIIINVINNEEQTVNKSETKLSEESPKEENLENNISISNKTLSKPETKQLSSKTKSYLLVSIIILIFILLYIFIYLKSGKTKKEKSIF